jgi:sugar lactone lactonase YvrE
MNMSAVHRLQAEIAVPLRCDLGEGCVWLPTSRAVAWIDIAGHAVRRWSYDDHALAQVRLPEPPGAVAPRASGGLILAMRGGVFALDDAAWPQAGNDDIGTAELPLLCPLETDRPANRMNDGRCDRRGRFWIGSMSMRSEAGAGSLHRVGIDHRAERMLGDVTISNGLCFRGDDRLMYYIDTRTQRVDMFDFDLAEGIIQNRRPLVEIARATGSPDGMTIDADGCLWVALWGGSAVHRYTPAGTLDRIIEVPARRVSSCTFGGPQLDELFITTASGSSSDPELAENPHAGSLFVCRPGAQGLPADPYGG